MKKLTVSAAVVLLCAWIFSFGTCSAQELIPVGQVVGLELQNGTVTVAALEENEYYLANARTIQDNRAWTVARLEELGFSVLPSKANFVFATHENMDGEKLYLELKKRGVLIRHFTKERICRYNRITIGTKEQMQILIDTIKDIQKEWGL